MNKRPWWWKFNPWRALANRERVYAEALDELQSLGVKHAKLVRAAKNVCRWDWSDNDDDCVADIKALEKSMKEYGNG